MSAALVVVLAGGASRRMGAPKPLAALGGRPLIAWPLAAAAEAGLAAVVVAKRDTPLPALDVPVWLEPDTPRHPLTGLVHALERAGGPVVAVACDQPWVPAALLAELAATDAPVVAARAAGELEPFPARWSPEVLPALREALAAEAPLRRTLASLAPDAIDAEPDALASLNTPEALGAAERHLDSLRDR